MSHIDPISLSACLDGLVPPREEHIEAFDRMAKYNKVGQDGQPLEVRLGEGLSLCVAVHPDTGRPWLIQRTLEERVPLLDRTTGKPVINPNNGQAKTWLKYSIDAVRPLPDVDEGEAIIRDIRQATAVSMEAAYGTPEVQA